MKNKAAVFKEYSTALLTIGSVIAGTFNCLFYYVYGIGAYVYFIMNFLIIGLLIYLCRRIHDKFIDEEGFAVFYMVTITVVIPFVLGSFLSLVLAIE